MNSSLKEPQETNSANNELNSLKEFYLYLKSAANQNTASKVDLCSIVENLLQSSVQCKEKPAKNPRYDMACTIVDYILANEIVLAKDTKLPECVASKLNQAYFEQLVKAFSIHPMNALKTAKFLIKSLNNVLHLNLSIVNPLLQVIECGFKHGNNEIKSFTYECWKCLILNFALDREFFFKTKKFNLIITPLLSICKAYKDELVSKSKALTWLCLIENINERMPTYLERVLLPFFEFCFGLSDSSASNAKKQETVSSFDSLVLIGFEVYVSVIFNGNLKQLNTELRQKFKYVNLNRYYKIKQSMIDKSSWLTILKYYFQVFPKKVFLDCNLMIEIWNKMCHLLKLNDLDEEDAKNWNEITKEFTKEYLAELECHYQYDLSVLVEFFLLSTFDLISNSHSTNKETTKLITELAKNLCKLIGSKPLVGNLLNNEKYSKEFSAAFKKSINLLLLNEDEDELNYSTNLNDLLRILEHETSLHNWIQVASKFNDHLKHLKTKTSILTLTDERNEIVNKCLVYPFKVFENLEINESDLKQVISSELNLIKSFTSLIKSNRVKQNASDPMSTNDWCAKLFVDLNKLSLRSSDQTGDCVVKNLQMHSQFILYLLQNAIEFETINQNQPQCFVSDTVGGTGSLTQGSQIIERLNSTNKKLEICYSFFAHLVDLIKKLVRNFHLLLTSEQAKMNIESEKNKQLLQIFCSLIELMSILFTRVKSYQITNLFLVDFATSIEMLSDLNSLSKLAAQTCQSDASPGANTKRNARVSQQQHAKLLNQIAVNFQSNRHSNDLYDKFSMQIASFIQNHLNKSYLNHQFDSALLEKLEPIFYSFLKNSKLSLKQKTIQAWNTTFGKSTADSLAYPSRLEHLFSDLKDEMCKSSASSSTASIPWISLPFFRSLQTAQLTNSFASEAYDYDEKENKPKFAQPTTPSNEINKKNELKMNLIKEIINESSSSSVPVAMLLATTNKTPDRISLGNFELNKSESETQIKSRKCQITPTTANFVFSPAGQNSFANNLIASCPAGLGASSKSSLTHNVMRTPEASGVISRTSPRSLKHNSKRKLDLNALIDQMPDQEFVEINSSGKFNNNNNKSEQRLINKKKEKQPLTEHQKEMRRKKSFIPMEMQSVTSELECTVDSQMSCATTQDAYDYSSQAASATQQSSDSFKAMLQFSINSKKSSQTNTKSDDESINQMDISSGNKESESELSEAANPNKIIKFQSKIKPNKQIELFEVKQSETQSAQTKQEEEEGGEEKVLEQEQQEPSEVKELEILQSQPESSPAEVKIEETPLHAQSMEVDVCATPTSRRRSARLIAKDLTPKVETPKKSILSVATTTAAAAATATTPTTTITEETKSNTVCQEVESLTNRIVVSIQKVNADELLHKLNEELRNEKKEKSTTPSKIAKQEKQNVLKINHKLGAGKIVKPKLSSNDQQREMLRKIKYKNLIKKLKYGDEKNDKITEKEEEQQGVVEEKQAEPEVEEEEEEETKEEKNNKPETIIEDEEDDDLPLSKLVKNKANNESNILETASTKAQVEPEKVEQNVVENEKKEEVVVPSQPAVQAEVVSKPATEVSTPLAEFKKIDNFDEIAAETSESTAHLIQKLNSTPTTSILKKKTLQNKAATNGATVSRCLNLSLACAEPTATASNETNLTPNKRRVSFCDSVRVEEIEPNANKSLFRTTPKMPNRARLVLFNNNNTMINRQVSSPLASSTNSILNSLSNVPTSSSASTTSSQASSADSKLNSSLNSSPSVQSKFLGSSLNSIANQLKANSTRLSSCESSSVSSENVPTTATPMSPSTSLINFFSNNKQSFLSPRSTMIQQQMLHLNSQKIDSPSAPPK